MSFQEWLAELAEFMGGFFDEEYNLCVDSGDGLGANSYAHSELRQLFQSRVAPRVAADVLRQGGIQ